MVWRNPYQAERERERARINAAAYRELKRRHPDEFEQIRRDMTTPASSDPSDGARTAVGDEAGSENGAVGAVKHSSASVPSANSAFVADRSTSTKTNGGAAYDSAPAQTTTA